jgi:hypothetical protein
MIKSYEKGGLVETKKYEDGKIVVAKAPVKKENIVPAIGENYSKVYDSKSVHRFHFDDEPRATYDEIGGIPRMMYEKDVKKSMADTVKKARDAKPK